MRFKIYVYRDSLCLQAKLSFETNNSKIISTFQFQHMQIIQILNIPHNSWLNYFRPFGEKFSNSVAQIKICLMNCIFDFVPCLNEPQSLSIEIQAYRIKSPQILSFCKGFKVMFFFRNNLINQWTFAVVDSIHKKSNGITFHFNFNFFSIIHLLKM